MKINKAMCTFVVIDSTIKKPEIFFLNLPNNYSSKNKDNLQVRFVLFHWIFGTLLQSILWIFNDC